MVVGYKLELTAPPVQHKVKAPLRFSLTESKKIEAEISELFQKGALTNVTPDSDQFVSNLFLVSKRDGGSRPVINLKDLNEYLQYNHFKMEGIHLLRDLMRPNDWLGKIDLKDAYFVVPIWENHKKYLRFLWKDSLLEFACLPFGLAVAPRVFTKIMKPVVALLRRTDEGLEYRTINTYRSALSGVLPPMEGFPVGQHPLVVRLLKGILNLRPAMPRYQQSWDVNVALDYMRSLPGNQVLPLKVLTQKLALLLALTAPKRSSELKLLDLRFMRRLPEGVVFELPGITKTSSEIILVFFAKFDDCESICVLRCLHSYISRTNIFRPLVDPATNQQLLISYHRPHKPVQSCTIARWIKSFLGSAGIDTSIFKGHSTRSASNSKARAGGISLEDVLKMADWTGPSSFLRFYYRPSFTDDFARAVLQ